MGKLALLLAFILIFILLRLDRKLYPQATPALWIPAIWLLLVSSKGGIAAWFVTSSAYTFGGIDQGNSVDRLFISFLLLIGLLILLKRNFNWTIALKENTSLIVLILFALITVAWSDMPLASFKRWIRWVITLVIMAFVVKSEVDPRQALISIFRRTIYILIPISIVVIRYYGHLGRQYTPWSGEMAWIGAATHKNSLAALCTFSIFFLLWTIFRRWRKNEKILTWYHTYLEFFLILLALYLFMGPQHSLTYSSTSLACLVLSIATLLGLRWLKKRNIDVKPITITIFITFLIVFGAITPFLGHLPLFDVSEIFNRDSTLTGRSDLWERIIPYANEKFLLGYGIGGFWSYLRIEHLKTIEAHNGHLDVILNYGIIGLTLFSIMLVNSSRKAVREINKNPDSDWGIFWFCAILITLVYNISESGLAPFSGYFRLVILLQICCQTRLESNHSVLRKGYK